jgi:hypothetical protein
LKGCGLFDGDLPPFYDGNKHFKKLAKLIEKGEAAKRDVSRADGSGAHLGFQIRLRPPKW